MAIWDGLTLTTLAGDPLEGGALFGKPTLVVNVASRCGLTPQYTALEALASQHANVRVLGVPCNQFGKQEPGTAEEIATFCATNYGVTFPMLAKQDVNGAGRSPLYQRLVGAGPDIAWNFEKFVVDADGQVTHRFPPTTAPDAPEILAALHVAP